MVPPLATGSRVLMIVQNLPVPLDRRVWLECQALQDHGYSVSVICPRGPGDPSRESLDGVMLYKYEPAPQAKGAVGFAYEFAYSWARTAWLSTVIRRQRGFDVIQACNPPAHILAAGSAVATVRDDLRLRPSRPQPGAVSLPVRSAFVGRRAPSVAVPSGGWSG